MLAAAGEGALILAAGAISLVLRMPLLFTSLGPTAYEMVERPTSRSAKTYNVIVGHMLGLAAGFCSLWVLNAWNAPKVAAAGFVSSARLWSAVLAVVVTTIAALAMKASQPASLSTTLLVSLGSMQTREDAVAIAAAVLLLAAIGEPLRRQFAKAQVAGPV